MLRSAWSRSVWMKAMASSIKLGHASPARRLSASEGRRRAESAAGLALAVVVASAVEGLGDDLFNVYDSMPGTDAFATVEYAVEPPSDFF